MSDYKMIVTMCCVENVPIEYSHFYRLVLEDHGQEVADFFTEDMELPREDEACGTNTSSAPQKPLYATA